MSLPTIFDLCEPREDVRQGAISESDFAADLAQVLRRGAISESDFRPTWTRSCDAMPPRSTKSCNGWLRRASSLAACPRAYANPFRKKRSRATHA
jgi:hypothetical protein